MAEAVILCGGVMDLLPTLEADSFDACLTDPPYGLKFMGKQWDHGVPGEVVWREVLRVLKPGAPLMAFGGTRTHHRLMVAIEDAGFEIRDCLMWLYGSGFPKSLDISKAIDKTSGIWRGRAGAVKPETVGQVAKGTEYERTEKGAPATPAAQAWQGYGTALKPAWEPIALAMKPLDGTFAENALEHGVAGLNVDGGRIDTFGPGEYERLRSRGDTPRQDFTGGRLHSGAEYTPKVIESGMKPSGRWPANVLLDEEAATRLDREAGVSVARPVRREKIGKSGKGASSGKIFPKNVGGTVTSGYHGDPPNVSRFFYTAKAGSGERNAGLEGWEKSRSQRYSEKGQGPLAKQTPRVGVMESNHHPTVKPISLTAYLAKLILPPERDTPRRLLVPFCGSGSEIIGAMRAGWDECTGIEIDPDYAAISERRIYNDAPLLNTVTLRDGEE